MPIARRPGGTRRSVLQAAVAALLAAERSAAGAHELLRIVTPYPPGGATDRIARLLADWLVHEHARPVIVENHGGASGTLGTTWFAEQAEVGKALLLGTVSTLALAPLQRTLAYDPAASFAPVGLIGVAPLYLVAGPSVEAATLAQLVAAARRARPGLSYASVGEGTLPHLAAMAFCREAGLSMLHVPYNGSSQARIDMLAGRIDIMVDQAAAFGLDNLRSGRLRALAVFASARQHLLPHVPTIIEAGGRPLEMAYWVGVLAPRGTNPEQVAALNEDLNRWLSGAEPRAALRQLGIEPQASSPAGFAHWIETERLAWRARQPGRGEGRH